jgi:hypothetical protein
MSAVLKNRPLARVSDPRANMLVPQAYDVAWTELAQAFNLTLSPGQIALLTGEPQAASNAAPSTAPTASFPSVPMALGDRAFRNPISATMVPIGAGSNGVILGANPKRTGLTIQNNSASGGATFWIAFGQPAQQTFSIGLAPGQGLVREGNVPRDAVYILITGASGVTGGVIEEESFVDAPGELLPIANVGASAWGYGSFTGGGNAGGSSLAFGVVHSGV